MSTCEAPRHPQSQQVQAQAARICPGPTSAHSLFCLTLLREAFLADPVSFPTQPLPPPALSCLFICALVRELCSSYSSCLPLYPKGLKQDQSNTELVLCKYLSSGWSGQICFAFSFPKVLLVVLAHQWPWAFTEQLTGPYWKSGPLQPSSFFSLSSYHASHLLLFPHTHPPRHLVSKEEKSTENKYLATTSVYTDQTARGFTCNISSPTFPQQLHEVGTNLFYTEGISLVR